MHETRESESKRFSRSCFGDGNQIAAREKDRPTLRLDGSGRGEGGSDLEDFGRESRFSECATGAVVWTRMREMVDQER